MRNLTITLGLAIFALAGFYAGAKFESGKVVPTTPAASTTGTGSSTGATGGGGRGGGGFGGFAGAGGTAGGGTAGGGTATGGGFAGRGTFGQITAVSGTTLTIQDAQGNQVKVQLQPSTTISKTAAAAQSDLSNGESVTVTGQRGTDGSITASTITIVPAAAPRG